MLLHARTSMESYCQQMKPNIDHDTEPTKYFLCEKVGVVEGEVGASCPFSEIKDAVVEN
ncbi:hypothetical protein glysoja_040221 [Glycine soja]|uniref:Uncharacterized protein n=1 Tax=Glycine soja TaxID=3848 RepID=A0A0B2RAS4_GLYSO|nr:hypothetical protein glysoja_040221 [Glycine soja]